MAEQTQVFGLTREGNVRFARRMDHSDAALAKEYARVIAKDYDVVEVWVGPTRVARYGAFSASGVGLG